MDTAGLVGQLWRCFQAHDWAGARAVLDDRFGCDWPQTGEPFGDAASLIAMNRRTRHPTGRSRRSMCR